MREAATMHAKQSDSSATPFLHCANCLILKTSFQTSVEDGADVNDDKAFRLGATLLL
jgi:hypothetical protein